MPIGLHITKRRRSAMFFISCTYPYVGSVPRFASRWRLLSAFKGDPPVQAPKSKPLSPTCFNSRLRGRQEATLCTGGLKRYRVIRRKQKRFEAVAFFNRIFLDPAVAGDAQTANNPFLSLN